MKRTGRTTRGGPSGPPLTRTQRRAQGLLPLDGVALPAVLAAGVKARLGPEPWPRGALSRVVHEAVAMWLRTTRKGHDDAE